MLKVIRTKNWKLYWGPYALPEGAEGIGLVMRAKEPMGALFHMADDTYAQGNAGRLRSLPQRSVEKAIAAAHSARPKLQRKPKPQIPRNPD